MFARKLSVVTATIGRVYDSSTRRRALRLLDSGLTLAQASRRLGISPSTLREWRDHPG
ncbi:helix-turn-helix domain-containing protein [Microbispora cellulosiformans]|uniref:Helix-turn-helix domain-containing protein n=1 Tax=Microbispora cellulosiformans TaxID=2614688 RepID=A0A5J5K6R6_9ACTN|nr:helix-turn-helix domain-containing protein [Microbispora cellulosiformans]